MVVREVTKRHIVLSYYCIIDYFIILTYDSLSQMCRTLCKRRI